jgi:hypothetical protein
MPIEINEIAIQLKVRDEAVAENAAAPEAIREGEREAIVADCVARVLRAIKAQQER